MPSRDATRNRVDRTLVFFREGDYSTVAAVLETARTHTITRHRPIRLKEAATRAAALTCRRCTRTYSVVTYPSHTCQPYAAYVDFILFLARTGARLGEALAVRFGDINFSKRTVRIQRNWVRRQLTTPKNHHQRNIDLSAQLAAALKARFERVARPVVGLTVDAEADLAEARAAVLDRYVFGDGDTPMDGDNFRKRIWEPPCVDAKVGKVRIHDLRHGYASQLIAAGKPIHYIQQQLGHHSPAFTLSVYGHLFPEDQHSNVDVLARLALQSRVERKRGRCRSHERQRAHEYRQSHGVPPLESSVPTRQANICMICVGRKGKLEASAEGRAPQPVTPPSARAAAASEPWPPARDIPVASPGRATPHRGQAASQPREGRAGRHRRLPGGGGTQADTGTAWQRRESCP